MSTSTETHWAIVRAQAGDAAALQDVLRAACALATPVVRRVAGGGSDDVLQDVLWTVARKLEWLEEPQAFRAWVYRIAVRAAVKHVARERRAWPFTSAEDIEDLQGPEESPSSPLIERIPALLNHLTPKSRAVVVLHYLEELRLEEVAVVLDIPLGTVKSRLSYGLRILRRLVEKEGR